MEQRDWTFMVYLAGDNNLSTAGDEDLEEMRIVGSSDQVNVVTQFDNAGNHGTRRFHIKRDGADERAVELGETDSGSPDVLLDFVRWAVAEFPAKRYALVLWNHGTGWEPSELDRIASSVGSPGYSPREISERSGTPLQRTFFRSTLHRIFSLPTPRVRAICSDDGTGHSLDTIELSAVLGEVGGILGQPLDLLGMDACLMNNFEVAYQVAPYVSCLVASEENEPADGWPYETVLSRLVAEPELPTREFASHIVGAYHESYEARPDQWPITQSALDLSKVGQLAEPLDDLATALREAMSVSAAHVWNAQRRSASFGQRTLWDIAHFAKELGALTSNSEIRECARNVNAALVPGADRLVLAEAHLGDSVEHCGGVTVYLLPPLSPLSSYYDDLTFAQEHGWIEMLRAYHAA